MTFFILFKNSLKLRKIFCKINRMKKCLNCEKEIKNRNKYCSIACQKEYEYKEYIKDWKSRKTSGLRGDYQISQHIRKYMFEKSNYSCSRCGCNELNP